MTQWDPVPESPVKDKALLQQIIEEALEPLPEPWFWRLEHIRHPDGEYPAAADSNGNKLANQLVLSLRRPNKLFPGFLTTEFRSVYLFTEWQTAQQLVSWLSDERRVELVQLVQDRAKPILDEWKAEQQLSRLLADPTEPTA